MRYFKIEFKRLLFTKSFWIAMVIACCISIGQYISYGFLRGDAYGDWVAAYGAGYMIQPSSLFISWIGGELNSMFMFLFLAILPLLGSFAYSGTYLKDRKLGQIKNVFTRLEAGNYYRTKWIIVFIAGFLVAFIPLVLNVYLHLTYSIPLKPIIESLTTEVYYDRAKWIFDLYYNNPWVYMGLYVFMIALFSGVYATLGMAFSIWIRRGLVAVIGPLILWRVIDLVFSLIHKSNLGMSNQLFPTLAHMNLKMVGFYLLFLLSLSILPIYIRYKRKGDF